MQLSAGLFLIEAQLLTAGLFRDFLTTTAFLIRLTCALLRLQLQAAQLRLSLHFERDRLASGVQFPPVDDFGRGVTLRVEAIEVFQEELLFIRADARLRQDSALHGQVVIVDELSATLLVVLRGRHDTLDAVLIVDVLLPEQ